ncbi:hypothetical protein LARI1_G001932 [Lachnellula arida]|uniref:Rhodopsin domain-containing protein n=1 Tax=Lachnellula arida TaxID=1316785 RepID=A0A8T9BPX4_9HELO|nr:hypothetical protein LARI1_G001932 [Lachnellula arida]
MSQPTHVPSIPPPPGHEPFGNDGTLWKWDILCVTVCLLFTTILFVLRTYVRFFVRREWLFEDWLIAYCGLVTTVMNRHGGVHEWDLMTEEVHSALYWFNIASIEYGIEILLCKLTILMMYRRVFVPHRWGFFDIVLRTFEAILIFFYFSITVVKIFECNPRARIWNKKLHGTCINIDTMLNSSGLFNMITDILILLVPIKSVWKLQMKKAKKLRVVLVFTFALIAPVFSLIGFLVRERISHSPDATYNQPLVLLWAIAEVSTGFICICLPPLSLLFNRKLTNPGPTQSMLSGEANKLGSANTQSRRRTKPPSGISDDGMLNADYIELEDGHMYTMGIERPTPTHVVRVGVGATPSIGAQNGEGWPQTFAEAASGAGIEEGRKDRIVKTVTVEQSYI